jgi:pyruvate dehydrogenase E1 component alpha subunit
MFVKLHRGLRKSGKRVLARDGLWAQVPPDPGYARRDRMQTSAPPTPPVGALPEGADDASLDPAYAGAVSDELAVALYDQMVLARELDGRLVALQREGRIVSYASSAGEEAAIVGAAAALRDEDWVFLASREMAAALWRGMPLSACAHHLFGAASSAGKGRNLHAPPFWKPTRVVSVSPLSGTQIPHAVGVFFGEGATSSGDFHTGLNFAGVTRAPVLAVCRNNGWATSLPASRQTASDGFAMKAVAYGLHGVRVDGADVAAVLGVVREARARACAGEGGTLIEAVTSPRGEDESDEAWAHRDPIARTRRYLEGRGLSSAERDRGLFAEVHADVDRAIADAASAPVPTDAALFDDVYAVEPWHLREQRIEAVAAMAGRAERHAAEGGTNT